MESEPESQLYRYLSEVGIREKSPGKIDFNPVNLDRALEVIVRDGDRFLMEGLYSYAVPDQELTLSVTVGNRNRVPDMSNWTEEQRDECFSSLGVYYEFGKWIDPLFYNIDNGKVEKFDPVAFEPKPIQFSFVDHPESYGRVHNLVRKAKGQGYEIIEIVLGESRSDNLTQLYLGRAGIIDDGGFEYYLFEYANLFTFR